MKFSAILSAVLVAALGVTSVTAAAAAADIAADPDSACRCPNNCSHKFGDSCKFYDNGNVISGSCCSPKTAGSMLGLDGVVIHDSDTLITMKQAVP
ncbi:hypothetical protein LENED_008127 [Lentinula edodes]|uniref:Uncharacterized protein n=1 Tax=Lentinula edodes TaxID=5353 RepID=A0A1Q3EGA1_LENED|nr:hypothetical protein LENED_008127 [Lentinula edodes]